MNNYKEINKMNNNMVQHISCKRERITKRRIQHMIDELITKSTAIFLRWYP